MSVSYTHLNGKVRGEQVEITVRAAGSGNLTEVDFRIGNRIQDDCTLETGLPPIQDVYKRQAPRFRPPSAFFAG